MCATNIKDANERGVCSSPPPPPSGTSTCISYCFALAEYQVLNIFRLTPTSPQVRWQGAGLRILSSSVQVPAELVVGESFLVLQSYGVFFFIFFLLAFIDSSASPVFPFFNQASFCQSCPTLNLLIKSIHAISNSLYYQEVPGRAAPTPYTLLFSVAIGNSFF